MESVKLEAALDRIQSAEQRFSREAYFFLNEALKFALDERKKKYGEDRHIRGPVLLDAVRRYALRQFGPMVPMVFDAWGIRKTEDFGHMVFQLVDAGFLRKTEDDTLADFQGVFDFHEAFVTPFLPPSVAGGAPLPDEEVPLKNPH
jgi:uncharacterized repeat protein (TIGR04138 family)